jgi:hypothetical protein
MEENLSQTSSKVPGPVFSLESVPLLQTVNMECLVHFICVHVFYILSGYAAEFSRLTRCWAIKVRPIFIV